MVAQSTNGRMNRMGSPEASANMKAINRSIEPYGQAATQTPPSRLQIKEMQVSPGGVQTQGDQPQQFVQPEPVPYAGPEQRHRWWQQVGTNDQLIFRDRHGYMQTGTERGGRISSMVDPLESGPPRPDFRAVNVTTNYQVGEGAKYADDLTRPYTWLGPQESGWSVINGGTVGFYRNGPGGAPANVPVDGPQRVWAGPPHGYHTYYPPDGQQTLQVRMNRAQMVGTRVDRMSNSRIAGQNYSQTTKMQGQK